MTILLTMSPRSKEFDVDSVLNAALDLFWRKGYKPCCIADVVKKTRVARYGLYQRFKDKDHLYRSSLKHYCKKLNKIFGTDLCKNSTDSDLTTLVNHFDLIIQQLDTGKYQGCFAHQAAIERANQDEQVNEIVQNFFDEVKGGYRAAIESAIKLGQVRDMPVEDLVSYVMGIQRAVIVMTKQNCSIEERRNYVNCALTLLKP